jgi:hypothetical protein
LEDLVGSITRYSSLAALLDDGDRAPSAAPTP